MKVVFDSSDTNEMELLRSKLIKRGSSLEEVNKLIEDANEGFIYLNHRNSKEYQRGIIASGNRLDLTRDGCIESEIVKLTKILNN